MRRAKNSGSFFQAVRTRMRMSFREHWASNDLSFNSESHLRWLTVGVLDPSTAAPDGPSPISLKATGQAREEKLGKILAFHRQSYLLRQLSKPTDMEKNCDADFARSKVKIFLLAQPYR